MESGLKTQFLEHQINAIETEGVFVAEQAEISIPETGAVANDYTSSAFVDIFKPLNISAISPPGVGQSVIHPRLR